MKLNQIIDPNLRWELLKYEIRKASIGFSKSKGKKNRKLYEDLEIGLNEIETKENWWTDEQLITKYIRLSKISWKNVVIVLLKV